MTDSSTILIRKYENRRLYDATNSRYVNLDEVAQFVKLGYNVQVIDVASGEDITRVILTQIIAEGAKTPDSTFPLDVLRHMVIASGRASQEGAIRYMKAMTDVYQSTMKAMAPALNPFDFMQGEQAGEDGSQDNDETSRPARRDQGSSREVDDLKQRLAELEKMVSSMAPEKKPRKKPRARSSVRKK